MKNVLHAIVLITVLSIVFFCLLCSLGCDFAHNVDRGPRQNNQYKRNNDVMDNVNNTNNAYLTAEKTN